MTKEQGDKAQCMLFVEARVVGDLRIFGTELEHEALTRQWNRRWTRWGAARWWMATTASRWGGDDGGGMNNKSCGRSVHTWDVHMMRKGGSALRDKALWVTWLISEVNAYTILTLSIQTWCSALGPGSLSPKKCIKGFQNTTDGCFIALRGKVFNKLWITSVPVCLLTTHEHSCILYKTVYNCEGLRHCHPSLILHESVQSL